MADEDQDSIFNKITSNKESARRCSHCGNSGHNTRTCKGCTEIKLFGVVLKQGLKRTRINESFHDSDLRRTNSHVSLQDLGEHTEGDESSKVSGMRRSKSDGSLEGLLRAEQAKSLELSSLNQRYSQDIGWVETDEPDNHEDLDIEQIDENVFDSDMSRTKSHGSLQDLNDESLKASGLGLKRSRSAGDLKSYSGTALQVFGGSMEESSKSGEINKGKPWSREEHLSFLKGLEKLGKGDWKGIANEFVPTKTSSQVASHAQKYFIRKTSTDKKHRRSSVFDISLSPIDEEAEESSSFDTEEVPRIQARHSPTRATPKHIIKSEKASKPHSHMSSPLFLETSQGIPSHNPAYMAREMPNFGQGFQTETNIPTYSWVPVMNFLATPYGLFQNRMPINVTNTSTIYPNHYQHIQPAFFVPSQPKSYTPLIKVFPPPPVSHTRPVFPVQRRSDPTVWPEPEPELALQLGLSATSKPNGGDSGLVNGNHAQSGPLLRPEGSSATGAMSKDESSLRNYGPSETVEMSKDELSTGINNLALRE